MTKHNKPILVGILLTILFILISRLPSTRPSAPQITPPPIPAQGPLVSSPPPASALPVNPESPPVGNSAVPPPRPESSRTASRRDLGNPLVPAETSSQPPRRAAESEPEIAAEFDKISIMFRDYRSLHGENPVGTNAEIMKAIIGGNPKGAVLGPPEGQTLGSGGELLDPWGTPYFFHQLSSIRVEIRSAGPDRRMWNEDDLGGE